MDADNHPVKPELVHFQAWAVLIRDPISGNMAWKKSPELYPNKESAIASIRHPGHENKVSGLEYYVVVCEIDAELVHFAKRRDK